MRKLLLFLTFLCQFTIGVAQQADFQKAVARFSRRCLRVSYLVVLRIFQS